MTTSRGGAKETLKLFVKGKAVDKYTGERSLSALQEYVENAADDLKEAA